jgi:hypothetical protein
MKRLVASIASLLMIFFVQAQNDTAVAKQQVATGLRADGKIWVVMAVCITILVGLFIYVISLDRKISRLEKH